MYAAKDNTVIFVHRDGDEDLAAECIEAQRAADMLNKARHLNDVKRQYTAAARLIAKAECLPGFKWI